jgi:hypothetical protein
MTVQTSKISANYQVGDVCQFRKSEEGHPIIFTTHKVDNDYGVVYYYMLDGTEECIGTSYIKKVTIKSDADLSDAELGGADLSDAELGGADLSDAY